MEITVIVGQQRKVVSERTARMIEWLCEHDCRVSTPTQISISFDCAGSKTRAQIVEFEQIEHRIGQAR